MKCESCGREIKCYESPYRSGGKMVCYECNAKRLNEGEIEDGATCFEECSDINCPYCGTVVERLPYFGGDYVDGNHMTCPCCGKEFYVQSIVEYTWNTYRIDKDGVPIRR